MSIEAQNIVYNDGEIIFAEFERGDKFYLIQSGSVEIIKTFGEASKTIDILKPGETFGEMALLEDSPRSATAIALGETKLTAFGRDGFEQLVLTNPQLAFRLLKMFVRRIYEAKRRALILGLNEPNARVADVFLMLDENNTHTSVSTETKREFTVTIDSIARWAGLSVSQAKESVGYYIKLGYLELYKDKFVIKNINNFIRIVSMARGKHKRGADINEI
ncbi:MAG: cyclic nucleotide-binding domain-containing protein [Spirochaetaceae bacterium]|jgi:CRP-like cAMP-binding protein|nr:cyclic nucleotide-binding domain-containing protein [Spirochaetaceae bacterium]